MSKNYELLTTKSFEKSVVASFDAENLNIGENWKKNLLKLCAKHCQLDTDQKTALKERLNDHIGEGSTYTRKTQLVDALKVIYARLKNQLDPAFTPITADEQHKIILSLVVDGIPACTEGFYNRVIPIVDRLKLPATLTQLLTIVRGQLVDNYARYYIRVNPDLSEEGIHVHAAIINYADEHGFGIKQINSEDIQIPLEADISSHIEKYFNKYYRAFFIIKSVADNLALILENIGYKGHCEQGYVAGHYEAFKRHLEMVLNCDLDYDIFINDESGSLILDLDWMLIKFNIWQQLFNNGFFKHGPAFDLDYISTAQNIDNQGIGVYMRGFIDFIYCVECFEISEPAVYKPLFEIVVNRLISLGYDHGNYRKLFLDHIQQKGNKSQDMLFTCFMEDHRFQKGSLLDFGQLCEAYVCEDKILNKNPFFIEYALEATASWSLAERGNLIQQFKDTWFLLLKKNNPKAVFMAKIALQLKPEEQVQVMQLNLNSIKVPSVFIDVCTILASEPDKLYMILKPVVNDSGYNVFMSLIFDKSPLTLTILASMLKSLSAQQVWDILSQQTFFEHDDAEENDYFIPEHSMMLIANTNDEWFASAMEAISKKDLNFLNTFLLCQDNNNDTFLHLLFTLISDDTNLAFLLLLDVLDQLDTDVLIQLFSHIGSEGKSVFALANEVPGSQDILASIQRIALDKTVTELLAICKPDFDPGEVQNIKTRLNIHGHKKSMTKKLFESMIRIVLQNIAGPPAGTHAFFQANTRNGLESVLALAQRLDKFDEALISSMTGGYHSISSLIETIRNEEQNDQGEEDQQEQMINKRNRK